PLYMQIVQGASPIESGMLMLPLVAGLMIAGIVAGLVTSRTGRIRGFPIFGTALATVGLLLMYFLVTATTPLVVVAGCMFVLGYGLGNCMQSLTLIVQNAVPPRDIGVATASATFFRQLGGTLGVAVFLSILFSTVGDKIQSAVAAAPRGVQVEIIANRSLVAQFQNDSTVIGKLSKAAQFPFKVGFADSMHVIFLVAAGIMFLGFLVLLLMPRVELRSQSASEAAKAEAAGVDAAGADADIQVTEQPTEHARIDQYGAEDPVSVRPRHREESREVVLSGAGSHRPKHSINGDHQPRHAAD
ncbi:MAG: MFS transporter, partial [Antricoccus sp.]